MNPRLYLAFPILVGPAPPGSDLWPGPTLHPMHSAVGAGWVEGGAAARSSQTGGAARAGVSKSQAPREEGQEESAREDRGGQERRRRRGEEEETLEVRAPEGQGGPREWLAEERRMGQEGLCWR